MFRAIAGCSLAIGCGFSLAACQSNDIGPITPDTVTQIVNVCPPEAKARVETFPKDPLSGAERNMVSAAVLNALGEAKGVGALEYDQVTVPGVASRALSRLERTRKWCLDNEGEVKKEGKK